MLGRVATVEDRVKADLEAGRVWKARDRLLGVLRVDPSNQWAHEQLGDVYFRMGDLPQAGRAWFLTTKSGADWERAEAAFYERYGKTPSGVVAALKVRAAIDRFPPAVQERLRTLQRRLEVEGRFWEPSDRGGILSPKRGGRLSGMFASLVVLLLLAALGIGLYNIALFLIHAITH
jgi:tetratricopeptide (TPR) repeat protein